MPGLYSTCLADSALSSQAGSIISSPGARAALNTAADGELPTGADIKALAMPYNSTVCDDAASLDTSPFEFTVFCNGDGTVAVSIGRSRGVGNGLGGEGC